MMKAITAEAHRMSGPAILGFRHIARPFEPVRNRYRPE
jgi:hypothetical protein